MTTNTIKVIDNFLPDDSLIDKMVEYLERNLQASPRKGIYTSLGWENSYKASQVGKTIEITDGYAEEDEWVVKEIGKFINLVEEAIEEEFGHPAGLVNGNYQKMIAGSSNGMHSDTTDLMGNPLQPDGEPEEMEWSGLFYFNECGADFTGGEIFFPNQDMMISPKRNQLVIFRGDFDHIHEVKEITSGERKNFCFFYGREGNISQDRSFFTVQDEGYDSPGSWAN